jgi:hypothetical protein
MARREISLYLLLKTQTSPIQPALGDFSLRSSTPFDPNGLSQLLRKEDDS